jgi:hypothetical protein
MIDIDDRNQWGLLASWVCLTLLVVWGLS